MTTTTKEIVWLRWLLIDTRVSLSHLISMYCDNQNLFRLLKTQFFMNKLSILRSIVLLIVIISSIIQLLYLLFLLLLCRLQISLPSGILFFAFVF